MYTFIISAVFFLLLSGIIFGKRLKKNQFFVILIVFLGTMIACVTVNGIVGKRIPLTFVKIKEKPLLGNYKSEIEFPDTTIELETSIFYGFKMNKKHTITNHIKFGWQEYIDTSKLVIQYLTENDTVPRWQKMQERRIITSKWIVPFGIPRGKRYTEVYLPNDSIHNELMSYINKYFYENKLN